MDNEQTLSDKQKRVLPEFARITEEAKAIQSKKTLNSEDRVKLDTLTTALAEAMKQLKEGAKPQRSGEFSDEDTDLDDIDRRMYEARTPNKATKVFNDILRLPAEDPDVKEAQEHLDRANMLAVGLKKDITETEYFWRGIKNLKLFQKLAIGDVRQNLTATGWQPAEFSSRMIMKIRMNLVVAALHERIEMPADPYRWPVEGEDANCYRVPERGGADDFANAANWVYNGLTVVGSNLVMASEKVGTRVVLSTELTEDSFIPILTYVENKIARGMADLEENVCINGDTTATLDDLASTATNNQRRSWHGYRKYLELTNTAKVNAGGGLTVDISHLRRVRQKMGKYAIRPSDVVWLCGPEGYIKLLSLSAGSHESPVQTLDKYGSQATILTGELGRVDGVPIIVTEFIGPAGGEMLNASGIYDGITETFTELLLIRPEAFIFGDRREAQLKRREIIETDQQVLVTLRRLTFMNRYPNVPVVGGVYNILK